MSDFKILWGSSEISPLLVVPDHRVLSASYTIEDAFVYSSGSTGRILAQGNVAVDSFSVGVTATAGLSAANVRNISVDSTDGARLHATYEIVSFDGTESAYFRLDKKNSSTLVSKTPIPGTYASGSTVQGVELSIPVDSSIATNQDLLLRENPLTLSLRYSVEGQIKHKEYLIEIVRNTGADYDVWQVESRILEDYPSIVKSTKEKNNIASLIKGAFRAIEAQLLSHSFKPEEHLLGPVGIHAAYIKTQISLAEQNLLPGIDSNDATEKRDFIERKEKEYFRTIGHYFVGKSPAKSAVIDKFGDTATEKVRANPFSEL